VLVKLRAPRAACEPSIDEHKAKVSGSVFPVPPGQREVFCTREGKRVSAGTIVVPDTVRSDEYLDLSLEWGEGEAAPRLREGPKVVPTRVR
jgi:hypothetical protein